MQNNYLNYYQLLEVSPSATTEEIIKAYKDKAKEYHPDKNDGHHTANKLFQFIHDAKEVLSDPAKRLEYDYMAGIKKRIVPFRRMQLPLQVNQEARKKELANAALSGAAVGLLVGLFFGDSDN